MPTTWEEYIWSPPGAPPPLGRAQVLKQNGKQFKAIVAMVGVCFQNEYGFGFRPILSIYLLTFYSPIVVSE
jgi:hypothetical protein